MLYAEVTPNSWVYKFSKNLGATSKLKAPEL